MASTNFKTAFPWSRVLTEKKVIIVCFLDGATIVPLGKHCTYNKKVYKMRDKMHTKYKSLSIISV